MKFSASIVPIFLLGLASLGLSEFLHSVTNSDQASVSGSIETSGNHLPDTAIYDSLFVSNTTIEDRAVKELFCQTSGASPPISYVHGAANRLIATHGRRRCIQRNPAGSRCTELYRYNGAQISICNGGRDSAVKCTTAAWAAKHIANNCRRSDGKTGGYYKFTELGLRIVVH